MLMGVEPPEEAVDTHNNGHSQAPASDDPTMADPTVADALTKTRRVQPKLTSDILLSERGLPYLVKHGPKRLRISTSRNKPYDNLSQIVRFYQLWAHKLYPRAKFKDFIKICQSMKNDRAVRDYRTELCMKEMYPSRTESRDNDDDNDDGNGDVDDDDIYQESLIREPQASEQELGFSNAETGAQREPEVPEEGSNGARGNPDHPMNTLADELDTQEPQLETQPLEAPDEELQEDEDAMEAMKELGF